MKITEFYKLNEVTGHYEYCCFREHWSNLGYPKKLHPNHKDYDKLKWTFRYCRLENNKIVER